MTAMSVREAGFTLMETLVALVVVGLLIVGLGQGLRFGVAAWSRQQQAVGRTADLDAVDRALRGIIARIDPGNSHDAPTVTGTSSSMEFTSVLPDGAAALPTRRAEMRLLVDGGHRLVLRWAPYTHAQRVGPRPAPTNIVLVAGVDHIVIDYLARGAAAAAGWQAAWRGPGLPALVRIRLVFQTGSDLHWPDIVAAPELAAP